MKRFLTAFYILTFASIATMCAQESQTLYNFLRLPVSAHAAALGGDNTSLIEDDASLTFHNPALLSSVSDKTIGFNFMTYMSGSMAASASFNRNVGEKISWAVSGQFINYGTMRQTDADNQQTGEFSAKDIAVSGHFSYMLGSRIAGGIAARFITSYIGSYNSLAMGVDLGLNYYDPDTEWSVSAVARNLGGQLKAYDDDFESMPFRLSATLVGLNHWNYSFVNHLVLGVDAVISESIWIGGGYNFRRAHDMKIESADGKSSHGAGLSFGAGLNLSRIKINLAYGKYHVSSSSIVVNAAFNL